MAPLQISTCKACAKERGTPKETKINTVSACWGQAVGQESQKDMFLPSGCSQPNGGE